MTSRERKGSINRKASSLNTAADKGKEFIEQRKYENKVWCLMLHVILLLNQISGHLVSLQRIHVAITYIEWVCLACSTGLLFYHQRTQKSVFKLIQAIQICYLLLGLFTVRYDPEEPEDEESREDEEERLRLLSAGTRQANLSFLIFFLCIVISLLQVSNELSKLKELHKKIVLGGIFLVAVAGALNFMQFDVFESFN